VTTPVLLNLALWFGQTNSFPGALKFTVVPSWVQEAETAKKVPAKVRATMIPFCTIYPPLFTKLPVVVSTVKSTLDGAFETLSLEQLEVNPPMHAGTNKSAAPKPTFEKNSLRSMFLSFKMNSNVDSMVCEKKYPVLNLAQQFEAKISFPFILVVEKFKVILKSLKK
jgi:hypothetical protein